MSTKLPNGIQGAQNGPIYEGEVVVLLAGADQDSQQFPKWGQSQGFVRGTVRRISSSGQEVVISWENGVQSVYRVDQIALDKYDARHDQERKMGISSGSVMHGPSMSANMTYRMMQDAILKIDPMYFGIDDGEEEKRQKAAAKKAEEEKLARLSKVDESHLDKLIVTPEVKAEIISLLKQSKYAKLIFEEWGLGETIEYGKGMTMLFWGGPGTGKTWGANCIAKATGRELLIINAANIQTSEPGGANRNIEQAFTTAREQNKVLFLDECDSLITTRGDVGMILSSEINTLLTQIEKFEGICILATNRMDSLDEALERRIALIVEFPDPNFEARKAIWQTLVPKKMPLGKDVSFDKLAEWSLTGGQIKNVVLQAARLAAAAESKKVELPHIEAAVKRVQQSKGKMGTAMRTHQHAGKTDYKVSHG